MAEEKEGNDILEGAMKFTFGCMAIVLTSAFVLASVTVLNGAVLAQLWNWFVVTLLDVPALTLVPSMGLGLTITFLTGSLIPKTDFDTKKDGAKIVLYAYGTPLIALAIGYVIQLFI